MKLRLHVRGLKELQKRMGVLGSSEIPIATATTLTRLAVRSQKEIRTVTLPSVFTLRRPAWARSGIRIRWATKKRLEAEVFDLNPYMVAQEETGRKLPKYGRYIAVPLRGARPAITSLIRKANLPSAVMAAGGFIRDNVIYKVRTRSGRRTGILPMYYLVEQWKWRPRYGFRATVNAIVDANYEQEFQRAFEQYTQK